MKPSLRPNVLALLALVLFFFGSGTAWAQAQQQLERAGSNEAAETALFGETNFITLINNNSDKCVDLNGANAQQSTCIGIQEASQVWQLDPSGAGFQIVNTGNGNCLEVAGVSLNPGANVRQAVCQEAAHHQWTFEVSGTGLTIKALHSNLCLEVAGSSTATGANIQQATCTGASNQEFRIGLPGDDYVSVERLPLVGTTACMVIEAGSNNLVANNSAGSGCDPSGSFPGGDARFIFVPIGSNFQIKNFTSQLCLEVEGVSTDNGANISQAACGTQANKVWRLVPVPYLDASGAGFNIIAAHSRKCLDESSVGTILGATISQFECIGGSENQIWDLVLVNSSPVAVDDVFEVAFETTGTLDVLNNDFDPDGDPILITDIPRNGSNGTATMSADSTMIRYTPNSGFLGTDNFDYQVSDFFEGAPLGGSGVATVTVNVTSTATVQFINASSAGTLDVFVNGANRADNLAPQTGTAYDASVPAGDVTVEFRDQGGTTMASFSPRLDAGQRDIFVLIGGSGGQALQLMRATEAQPVPITPVVVASPGQVKKFVLHASVSIGTVDLFLLDIDNMRTKQLGANLSFGQTTGYDDVPADLTQIQIANTQGEIDVFRFPLNAFEGKVVTVIFTSNGSNSMFLVDSDGNEIGGQITTATEDEAGVPDQFALDGNYPNPFNPVTTIRFDLPQTAAVSVEVIDVLGRVVMTIPSQQYAAGAQHRLEVDASSLSSGMYLYRVIAEMETETQIRIGRMTLIK